MTKGLLPAEKQTTGQRLTFMIAFVTMWASPLNLSTFL